tara:strand:+ start:142 stop:273 length:132 start_codon:yes stop_codon:yes gene_type:complete
MVKSYYSKIQQRFVNRDEYFDDLLYTTLKQEFNNPIKYKEDEV